MSIRYPLLLFITIFINISLAVNANFLSNRNELTKAKKISQAALSENPQALFSYANMLKLGQYDYYSKNYLPAEKYFQKALKYAIDSLDIAESNYWLGKTFLFQKKIEPAISCFSQVLRYNKKPLADFLLYYGIALYQVGQYEDALNCFVNYQAQTAQSQQVKELPLFIAAAALGKQDYNLSKDILDDEKLQTDASLYPIPTYLLALNYYLTDERSKSIRLLRKIAEDTVVSEITDNTLLILSAIYSAQNELKKAVQELDILIDQNQDQFKEYALLRSGITYFQLKQMTKANERFDTLLFQYPASNWADAVYYYKAKILEQNRRWSKAQSEYRKFIANYPNSELTEPAKINLGRLFIQDENYFEALTLYEDLITGFPKSKNREEILFNLFMCYYELKRYAKAQTWGEQFVHEFKKSGKIFQVYYWLGQIGISRSNRNYALKYLSLITGGNLYAYAMKDIGDIHMTADSFAQAVSYYNLAERFSADTILDQIRLQREIAYLKQGQYESALIMYRAFLEKYPTSPKTAQVQYQIGKYFIDLSDYSQAINELNKVYHFEPPQQLIPDIEINKAYCYEHTADTSAALISYLKIINDFTQSVVTSKAMMSAANIYYAREVYDSAIVFYSQLINQAPKELEHEGVYFALAQIYRKLNRLNESANLLERLILAYPESQQLEKAYFKLFDCYTDLGKLSDAEKRINEIFARFGKSGTAYHKLATLYNLQNKPGLAKINFINAFDFYLKENKIELAAISLLEAGKSAIREKKFSEARELFKRCMDLTKDERIRIESEKLLQSISDKKD